MSNCPRCYGSGLVISLLPPIGFRLPCPDCNGAGLGTLVVPGMPPDTLALVADPNDLESSVVVARNVGTGQL